MKYNEARELLKTGDMLLYRNHQGGGLRAMVERWTVNHGTASPYCHVGMALNWADRLWIMDITTKGCAPRILSATGAFDWAPSPCKLSDTALNYAADQFGELTYSRLQAVLGQLRQLTIGQDKKSQCAEYFLSIWNVDGMAPSKIATPAACSDGALQVWGSSITSVEPYNPGVHT